MVSSGRGLPQQCLQALLQWRADGRVVQNAISDASCSYRFENVPCGEYQVRCVVIDGYEYYAGLNESEFVEGSQTAGSRSQEATKSEMNSSPPANPLTRPSDTLSPTGGEGRVRGIEAVSAVTNSNSAIANQKSQITIESGRTTVDVNFRFTPFKKGTWTTYTLADGLASELQIRKFVFEPSGHVWIATSSGASRFDGTRFINFTTEDGLPDNFIVNMDRQSDGTLWFTTANGVSRYDGKKFVNYGIKDGLPMLYIHAA